MDVAVAAGLLPDASKVGSGTSQASAFAAGVAVLLPDADPSASPTQIREALLNSATPGMITGLDADTPNLLLYSLGECRAVPQAGCLQPNDASVQFKDDATDDAKDRFKWVWKKGDPLLLTDLADPSSSTRYWLCTYDDEVFAKGPALPLPTAVGDGRFFAQNPSVPLQLQSNTGLCWSSSFVAEATTKNDEGQFRAKAP